MLHDGAVHKHAFADINGSNHQQCVTILQTYVGENHGWKKTPLKTNNVNV